jgi:N-acyl-D-amino-acid deacylase
MEYDLKLRVFLLLAVLLGCSVSLLADPPQYDLLLKNGLIVDGSGLPPYVGDVALSDGKIAKVGHIAESEAGHTVDISGYVIAPGFIDLLCHNDLIWTRTAQERAIREGVTSGLVGNCGFSVLDVDKNLKKFQRNPGYANVGTLIGQGTLRDWFVKKNRTKPASPQDLATMKLFLQGALQAGAFGLSSGLGYEPGEWCEPAEIEDLASVLTQYPHAVYYTHIRNYRSSVLEAIQEALTVGEKAKIPVVIQHLLFKLPSNWDQTESGLRLLENAQEEGRSVYATIYPYDFWGNEVQIPLYQFLYLKPAAANLGYYWGNGQTADILAQIHKRLQQYGGGDKVEITRVKSRAFKTFMGKTIADMAKQRKISEEQAVLALLIENGEYVKICYHGLSEEGLIKKVQAPFILFGSDSSSSIPHPRDVGAFPRLLGTYVRDKRIIRLSEAIKRLTSEPASLMGLKDRGLLKEGYWGDVVVFDPKTIADNASAVEPWKDPTGMRMVFVNGQEVYDRKVGFLGRYPGKALRRENN